MTSPRTDKYGGSFENRTRLVFDVIQAVRSVIARIMPPFVRISAIDWMEKTKLGRELGDKDLESTIRFVKLLPDLGVDLLDIGSASNYLRLNT